MVSLGSNTTSNVDWWCILYKTFKTLINYDFINVTKLKLHGPIHTTTEVLIAILEHC